MAKYNDPIPKNASLVTFQISLDGYRPDQGDQDHLVKWINAPSKAALEKFIEKQKLTLDDHGVDVLTPLTENKKTGAYQPRSVEDGVDIVVDRDGQIVEGELGITTVMTRSTRSDKGKPRSGRRKQSSKD